MSSKGTEGQSKHCVKLGNYQGATWGQQYADSGHQEPCGGAETHLPTLSKAAIVFLERLGKAYLNLKALGSAKGMLPS